AARLSFRAAGASRQNENGPGLGEHRKARAFGRGKRESRATDITGDKSNPRAERFTCATSRGGAVRFSGESCRGKSVVGRFVQRGQNFRRRRSAAVQRRRKFCPRW